MYGAPGGCRGRMKGPTYSTPCVSTISAPGAADASARRRSSEVAGRLGRRECCGSVLVSTARGCSGQVSLAATAGTSSAEAIAAAHPAKRRTCIFEKLGAVAFGASRREKISRGFSGGGHGDRNAPHVGLTELNEIQGCPRRSSFKSRR